MRATLSAFLLTLLVTACAGPEPFREGVRANDRLVLADDVLLTRLVDDLTGAPLIGAEVFLVDESKTPIAGEFWYSVRAVSDAEGFVRIARPTGATSFGWQVVRHRECGVATRTGTELVWRVGRAFDVPVRITDWLGRPAAGARIGFCGGCGHTPDLVNAVAADNGIAVLRGIDPQNGIADLYVQHPGLHYFYDSVDWLPGGPPLEVRCAYAPALSGRVVDHRGVPVAGAFVCGGSQHRGPWARTAADGSFTVLGAEQPTYPHHVVTPQGRDVYFDTSTAWPVTLRLPDLAEAEANEGVVEQLAAEPSSVGAREVRVTVDGAPGELDLGTVFPGLERGREAAKDHALVPQRGPFLLVASAADPKDLSERRFPFHDASVVREPLVVRWTPAVRLRGRAVDPSGQPVAVGARVRKHWFGGDEHQEREEVAPLACAGGEFDLPCVHTGTVLLELAPAAASLRPRLLWVEVPAPGTSASIELGAVVVGGEAQLRVVDSNGVPASAAVVGFARPGWQEAGLVRRWPLGVDGAWAGPDLRAGDTIVVQRERESLPQRTVLHGPGPWTIALPAGQLDLEIVGADGQPLAAVIVVSDHEVDDINGIARLRGLPCGPCRAFVFAAGHRTAIVDTLVTAAPRTVRVVLPER